VKLLILSDIHGNWPALDAVLDAEGSWDAVACCGDLVDYGPHPVECLRWVAEHADYCVRGNHDNAMALGVDCHCLESFRELSQATRAWHANIVDEFDRFFLVKLPTIQCFKWREWRFRMAHATPQGGLFEYLPMDRWKERVDGLDVDYVLIGHTHIQGMRTFGDVTVVNPGSVGLAHDVPGEACYAVCDEGRMRLERVPYDVSRTVADLRRGPIPRRVIEGLVAFLNPGSGDAARARRRTGFQCTDQPAGPTAARTVDSLRGGSDGNSDVTREGHDHREDTPGPKSTNS
jgi:putative phosphoesterase